MSDILEDLRRWAAEEESVRAALLTGSRSRPGGDVDTLSDHDVLLFVAAGPPLADSVEWLRTFGPVLVALDESYELMGRSVATRLVQYADGHRIDFSLCPLDVLESLVEEDRLPELLDAGYRTLVDKDDLAARLPRPSERGIVPERPSRARYREVVNEFWWESTCAAKNLARREVTVARYNVERVMRFQLLVPMLEWYVESRHAWSLSLAPYSRGLVDRLPDDDAATLERTRAGPGLDDHWNALFAMVELFERAARAVAENLGYEHPGSLADDVRKHLIRIRVRHSGTDRSGDLG